MPAEIDDWRQTADQLLDKSRRLSDLWATVTHALALVTIIGLLVAIWLFSFRLTSRISQLNRNSLKMGRNQPLDPPMPGNDEVARVDQTLHRMAALISERQAALDRH
ncbi:MAG: hypothetical protein ACREML_12190, partial [Vulcanimicrobiaceae bacterium]